MMKKPSALLVVLAVLGLLSSHVTRGSATGGGGGERKPEVVIQNLYRGCQPRVECPPYEDDVLFRYKENYSFMWDTDPQKKKQITCTAQCTAHASQHKCLVSFVGAYRGSNVHKFQWRIKEDGGYLTTMDVNDNTIQPYKRMWKW